MNTETNLASISDSRYPAPSDPVKGTHQEDSLSVKVLMRKLSIDHDNTIGKQKKANLASVDESSASLPMANKDMSDRLINKAVENFTKLSLIQIKQEDVNLRIRDTNNRTPLRRT